MSASRPKRLAVLIDGENISPRAADEIFAAAAERGEAKVRRVFGDWQRSAVGGWRDAALKWAVETIHQSSQSRGDGAADVGMAIAAMDLLYSGRVDGFCLASGDGDFTPLAQRLRTAGLPVYGFGPPQAAAPFRLACTEFVPLTALSGAHARSAKLKTPSAALPPLDAAAVELLVNAVATTAGPEGWASLSVLGQRLRRDMVGYRAQKLGASSLAKALRRAGLFEVQTNLGSGRTRLVAPHLAEVVEPTAQDPQPAETSPASVHAAAL